MTEAENKDYTKVDLEREDKGSKARQMLGMKGASQAKNIWQIRLQLMKPITWIPLIWGGCLWGCFFGRICVECGAFLDCSCLYVHVWSNVDGLYPDY